MADEEAADTLLVKISAELRMLDRQAVDLVGRIEIGVGQSKSDRHVRAALARWNPNSLMTGVVQRATSGLNLSRQNRRQAAGWRPTVARRTAASNLSALSTV